MCCTTEILQVFLHCYNTFQLRQSKAKETDEDRRFTAARAFLLLAKFEAVHLQSCLKCMKMLREKNLFFVFFPVFYALVTLLLFSADR